MHKLANGDCYRGNWIGGAKSGSGTLSYYDGAFFKGNWANDIRSGLGEILFQSGDIFTGLWDCNKMTRGRYTFSEKSEFISGVDFDAVFSDGDLIIAGARVYTLTLSYPSSDRFYKEFKFRNGKILEVLR